MARTQKYTEELLLEAVVKYAEAESGKIKATELAAWAAVNISGLEGVRDYHFMRPVRERNLQTGVVMVRHKLCTVRMEEINRARSLTSQISRNTLLKASAIEDFMKQPGFVQRRQIAETRETVGRLAAKNESLSRANEALRAENKSFRKGMEQLTEDIRRLQDTQGRLTKKVMYLMKAADEKSRKAALADMGLTDRNVDLDVYTRSLEQEIGSVMDLRKVLGKFLLEEANPAMPGAESDGSKTLAEEVLSGIDFSGGKDGED
jgi:predicted  nucleic acid-binding Zn-ribbon protein